MLAGAEITDEARAAAERLIKAARLSCSRRPARELMPISREWPAKSKPTKRPSTC